VWTSNKIKITQSRRWSWDSNTRNLTKVLGCFPPVWQKSGEEISEVLGKALGRANLVPSHGKSLVEAASSKIMGKFIVID
jgi:hypothetical protein